MDDIKKLVNWIKESNRVVFFGGAGVSTESGMKDFRSATGLYNEKYKYPPETILSHTFFVNNPEEFFKYYKNKLNSLNYKPNRTHEVLAKLEKRGYLSSIITQNIDNLHQKAGSKSVYELHGSIKRNYCTKCHKKYDEKYIFEYAGIPKCSCGGIVRPDITLYEEPLNEDIYHKAITEIASADLLIIGGTSLNVFPAPGLIRYFHGKHLVLINRSSTMYDHLCDLVIYGEIGNVFAEIEKEMDLK